MAMKLSGQVVLAVLALATVAQASTLLRAGTKACGPQTKVCLADHTDAASTPQWECVPANDGAKVTVTQSQSEHGAKVCGPGTFHFSPMSCIGDYYDYKKQSIEVSGTAVTTECKPVSFPYDMACYSVDC
mmetsp:Transcript_106004/g.329242  ORF Transcript_106004/g.329242 Transcript_106004/m.329242 type:complete len:130 (-) Transcript_106004:132-521(-)